MTSKRRFFQHWNLDKTLSLLAFFISLGTFFLLYYQTNLTRKQQYASVLPYLEIFNRGPREDAYSFAVTNNGIGPAFIKQVKIYYKNKEYITDPVNFIYAEIYPQDTTLNFVHTNLPPGRMMPAGAVFDLIVVEGSKESATKLRKLFSSGSEALLEITYASVYDEEWVVRTGNSPMQLK